MSARSSHAPQPELALEPAPIDPASESALRIAYSATDWLRRGISFEYALQMPALRTVLRIRAEISARRALHPQHH